MKSPEHKPITSHWSITGTHGTPDSDRRLNFYIGVQADNMQQAIDLVRDKYYDIRFISIHHRGDIHFCA